MMQPGGDADQEVPAGSYRDYVAQTEKKRTNTNADKRKSPFDKVGLLTKLGGNVKNWLERGFALRSDYKLLHYFRSARDFKLYASDHTRYSNKIAGTINLVNARMFLATYISFENCLEISTAPPEKRHYYVYAKTAPELRAWINKLSAAGVTFVAPNCKLCEEELASLAPPPTGMAIYGMQGMIEKKGEEFFGSTWSTSFKARFFRIEENPLGQQTLAYYSRYDDVKPKGSIALAGSRIVEQIADAAPDESPECQWGIETPQRIFVLRSRSKPEKKVWIDVLRLIMENPNQPPPEVSIETDLHMEDISRLAAENGGLSRAASPPLVVGSAGDGDSDGEDETHRAHPHVSTTSNNPNAHSSSHISAGGAPNEDGDDVSVNGFENDANDQTMEDILHQTLAEQDEKQLPEEDEGPPPLIHLEAKTPPPSKPSLHSLGLSDAAAAQEKIEAKKQEEKEHEAAKQLEDSMKSLKDGVTFMKFGRFGNPHRKLVFIADDRVYWSDTDTKKADKSKSIYLVNMKEVSLGKETNVLKRDCAKEYSVDLCFSLVDHERSLDLACDSKELRDKWVAAFSNARKLARSS